MPGEILHGEIETSGRGCRCRGRRSLTASVIAAVTWTRLDKGHSEHPRDFEPDHPRAHEAVMKQDAQGARAAMASRVALVLRDAPHVRKGGRGTKMAGIR